MNSSASPWLRAVAGHWLGFASMYAVTGLVRLGASESVHERFAAVGWFTSGASLALLASLVTGGLWLAAQTVWPRGPIRMLPTAVLGGAAAAVEVSRGARWDLRFESPWLLLAICGLGAILLHALAGPAEPRRARVPLTLLNASAIVWVSCTLVGALAEVMRPAWSAEADDYVLHGRVLAFPVFLIESALLGLGAALFWGLGAWLARRWQPTCRIPAWYGIACALFLSFQPYLLGVPPPLQGMTNFFLANGAYFLPAFLIGMATALFTRRRAQA